MKIAYLTSYIGKQFSEKYCQGVKYALSAPLKSQGIARSLMAAGHEVVIYSPGITTCNAFIKSFEEEEVYPEGKLVIKYCNIISKRKCAPINDFFIHRFIKKELKSISFDAFLYYNITFGAYLAIRNFKQSLKIIDYEDNIFTKSLVGEKDSFVRIKAKLYNYLIRETDYALVVCSGMMINNEVKDKLLIPGIINEEVTDSVSFNRRSIDRNQPVRIVFTGGAHHSKGADLLITSLSYVSHPCIVDFYSNGAFSPEAIEALKTVPSRHEVNLKGFMPHKELIKQLDNEADILISTSIVKAGLPPQTSGFPFKIMEYASTGRPIISSELSKLDDDFNHHITYYSGDEPTNIAKAIEEVIENYDKKVELAIELQQRVLDEFSIAGISKKIQSFFDKNHLS